MIQYQTVGILILILIVVISTLMVVYRNTIFIKLTWRYSLILLPALFLIAIKLLSMKKAQTTTETPAQSNLGQAINEIQSRVTEANQVTAIEVTATRTENKVKLEELKKVTQIQDDSERRKRIAEMMG